MALRYSPVSRRKIIKKLEELYLNSKEGKNFFRMQNERMVLENNKMKLENESKRLEIRNKELDFKIEKFNNSKNKVSRAEKTIIDAKEKVIKKIRDLMVGQMEEEGVNKLEYKVSEAFVKIVEKIPELPSVFRTSNVLSKAMTDSELINFKASRNSHHRFWVFTK